MKRVKILVAAGVLAFASVCLAGCIEQLPPDTASDTSAPAPVPSETTDAPNEVPDYLSDRGLIIRGEKVQVDEKNSYRKDSDNETYWFMKCYCDCDLSVESTDEEFSHFLERFSAVPYLTVYYDVADCATLQYKNGNTSFICRIYKTGSVHGDLSDGSIYFEDDPGYFESAYYSNDGKYYLLENNSIAEDILLRFLEPAMAKVAISFYGGNKDQTATFDNSVIIENIIDVMHSFEAVTIDKSADDILSGPDVSCVSFTDDAGKTYDYFFADDKYMVYNGTVYELSETEPVDRILRATGYWRSKDEPVPEEELELRRYLNLKGPYWYSPLVFFDVTGDGVDDYCTTVSGGSGWYRSYVVVYDPVSKTGYSLSDHNFDYMIRNDEELGSGRLGILKRKGTNNSESFPASGVTGTVEFVDGELQFVPDE